jgi:hypothetical protein
LYVFRADATGSGADYIGNYFEIDRRFAVHKAAGEPTRILVQRGAALPTISAIQ